MKVRYHDVEITDNIDVCACCAEQHSNKRADSVRLVFSDNRKRWDLWKPNTRDTIEVSEGACTTGKMFVHSMLPQNGAYTLFGLSAPGAAWESVNKSWQDVKLSELISEIAGRCALTVQGSVEAFKYAYVQQDKPNLRFLQERLTLEGYRMLVYDGRLVIYDGSLEQQRVETDLAVSTQAYRYQVQKEITGLTVAFGSYVGVAGDGSHAMTLETAVQSEAEANRFAANLLTDVNHDAWRGYVDLSYSAQLAAGTVAALTTEGAPTSDGIVFISDVRHDFYNHKTRVFLRRARRG